MIIRLSSASMIETIVTLGAAVLMTLAGLAMIADIVTVDGTNAFHHAGDRRRAGGSSIRLSPEARRRFGIVLGKRGHNGIRDRASR